VISRLKRCNSCRSNVRHTSQKFSLSHPANLSTGTNDSFLIQWYGSCSTPRKLNELLTRSTQCSVCFRKRPMCLELLCKGRIADCDAALELKEEVRRHGDARVVVLDLSELVSLGADVMGTLAFLQVWNRAWKFSSSCSTLPLACCTPCSGYVRLLHLKSPHLTIIWFLLHWSGPKNDFVESVLNSPGLHAAWSKRRPSSPDRQPMRTLALDTLNDRRCGPTVTISRPVDNCKVSVQHSDKTGWPGVLRAVSMWT
jgi:hypothetical protein